MGTAIVVYHSLPGQELRNADMILEEGAGIKINDSRMLGYKIEKILKDKKRLASLKKNAKRIGSTDSADKIAKYIFNADYYDTYMSPNARRSNYKKRGKNEMSVKTKERVERERGKSENGVFFCVCMSL